MTDELPPLTLGTSGLTGRPQIARAPEIEKVYDPETGLPVDPPPVRVKSMPSNCLRVLSSPLAVERGGGCNMDCPGRQRDGACLAEIVKAANAAGVEWEFEVSRVGEMIWWDYIGPEIPGR